MKANDNCLVEQIILPIPVIDAKAKFEMEIYARFMRHLRCVIHTQMEIKILASIQFVADMLDLPDAQAAAVLVHMGLRAPRAALPSTFLDQVDECLMRNDGPARDLIVFRELKNHWDEIGEDPFAAFRKFYPSLTVGLSDEIKT